MLALRVLWSAQSQRPAFFVDEGDVMFDVTCRALEELLERQWAGF
jgi:hypothetical protein